MDTRRLGGLDVSVVGLGCNNFGRRLDRAQTAAVVNTALDAGITLFDTADMYGDGLSEAYLGAALAGRRDQALVATKFGWQLGDDPETGGASAAWIERAVEESLRRLGTDRVDLYQLHKPDPATPIDDTLEALDRLVTAGKVREIGCSNFDASLIDASMTASSDRGLTRWVSVQNEYSLLHREPEVDVLDACERHGLGLLPYFPLAAGMLTGKYRRGEAAPEGTRLASIPSERAAKFLNDPHLDTVARLEEFCLDRGRTLLELAFSWLLARPAVPSVIAGATKPSQVERNVAAAGWQLGADDLAAVDDMAAPPATQGGS